MDNEKYQEYLKSEKWKRIAQQRMEIDGHQCVMCGCRGTDRKQGGRKAMNELNNADTATLWGLMSDLSQIMKQHDLEQGNDTAFWFWFEIYISVRAEIDRRLAIDFDKEV